MEVSGIWYLILVVLGVVAFCGLFFPRSLVKLSQITAEKIQASYSSIDKARFIDHKIYRSHKLIGMVMLVLSMLTLYLVLFVITNQPEVRETQLNGAVVHDWMLEVALVIATLGGVIGVCFGIVILLRPSLLKPLELWGNRWIHFPDKTLDKNIDGLDEWAARHTRLFSLVVLISAIAIWFLAFGLD